MKWLLSEKMFTPFEVLVTFMVMMIFLLTFACSAVQQAESPPPPPPATIDAITGSDPGGDFTVIRVDGCEYLVWYRQRAGADYAVGGIVHKGNCPNHGVQRLDGGEKSERTISHP